MENKGSEEKGFRRMSKAELSQRLTALQNSSGKETESDERDEELKAVLHEVEVYQIELEMQLRELRESRQALETSLDRYASLYDFAPVGYVTISDHGQIREVNLTAAGMLGVERKWLVDRYFGPWIVSTDLGLFRNYIKQCKLSLGIVKATLRLTNKEKQIIPVELTCTCEKDPATGATLFRIAITDLTDRKSAEADFDQFFNLSGDLLCIFSSEGRFKRVNPASEKMLGYLPSEMIGRSYWEFIHPDDRDLALKQTTRVKQDGVLTADFQIRYVRKDREVIWISWTSMSSGGQIYGAGRNITAHVLAKNEIENYNSKLKEEKTLRERFVSALTHDLRTPLTSAKLSAQLLARKVNQPVAVVAQSKKIVRAVDRADQMIQDLLDANRIKSGEDFPLHLAELDLASLVKHTLEELSVVHGKRFTLRADMPVVGLWSKRDLRRVIENLASNAVKYGHATKHIIVSVFNASKLNAVLTVQNFGTPIPEDEQLTLFKQFRRSSAAQNSGKKGWGIGLTLVRGIVRAHGGHIDVTSNLKEGTTFCVTLPVKPLAGT